MSLSMDYMPTLEDEVMQAGENEDEEPKNGAHDSEADEISRHSVSKDGRNFSATYEMLDTLGKGVASTVRRCVEKSSQKMYAVKIVDVTTGHQTESERDLLYRETKDEVQILRELAGKTSSLIELHDFYETATYLFLVFEMAPMGELFDVLTKEVTFSEKRTKRYLRQIIDAVKVMHEHNIIHRDVKLENVLCKDQDRIVLTDFGFSVKVAGPHVKLRELKGTPGYLAPETLRCQYYEDAPGYGMGIDIWACGVIMYTLLAGYAPFYHRKQLTRLLEVDPEKRITAAQALAHPFLSGLAVEVVEKPSPKKRFRIRHEAEAAVFAVFGHWVNKGFLESRDMLFANRPKPKRVRLQDSKGGSRRQSKVSPVPV